MKSSAHKILLRLRQNETHKLKTKHRQELYDKINVIRLFLFFFYSNTYLFHKMLSNVCYLCTYSLCCARLPSISQKQLNTLFPNSLVYSGQIKCKIPNPKRTATQQENIWMSQTVTDQLKCRTSITEYTSHNCVFFLLKHIWEIPADLYSEFTASNYLHTAWLIYAHVVLPFLWSGGFPGTETVFLVTHCFVQH